jgi:hypothetical protein
MQSFNSYTTISFQSILVQNVPHTSTIFAFTGVTLSVVTISASESKSETSDDAMLHTDERLLPLGGVMLRSRYRRAVAGASTTSTGPEVGNG